MKDAAPTTGTGDSRVFGPKDYGNASFRLTIKRVRDNRFAYKLEAKPLGGDDTAYKVVAAGNMTKGAQAGRGRGHVGFNLDVYKTVDSSFPGQGKLLSRFAHVGNAKVLAYRRRRCAVSESDGHTG